MDLLVKIYKLLKIIKYRKPPNFSGLGLVFYDTQKFDKSHHCDLRPYLENPRYNIADQGICEYFIDIANFSHTLHDGFHMINEYGDLTHLAQYFVPPVVRELKPNPDHGVRLYSSLCGSTIEGVLFIAVISSNFKIYLFKTGDYINLNIIEAIIANERKEIKL